MKPLVTNQRMLTRLCLCPAEENIHWQEKLAYIALGSSTFVVILSFVVSSAVFVVKNVSIDLEESLFAAFQFIGLSTSLIVFVITFFSRDKISAILKGLSAIYDEYENEESFKYLVRANNQIEWMWHLYFKYVMRGVACVFVVETIGSVVICWFTHGSIDAKYLFSPAKLILPWNQTLFSYFAEIFYLTIMAQSYLLANGTIAFLFISICLHHRTFYKMMRYSVRKLNRPDKNRNDKEHLCKLIRFHITVKEWFSDTADLYSHMILVYLVYNMIFAACGVFQMDLQLKHIDFKICPVMIATVAAISNLFVFCFFGKFATESYAKMADCLYECEWRELPLELQKYFVLMIGNAQRPLYYHGSGTAVLNLETFCKLLRAIFTYYMAFKTLASK